MTIPWSYRPGLSDHSIITDVRIENVFKKKSCLRDRGMVTDGPGQESQ